MRNAPITSYYTIKRYHQAMQKLRGFFLERGFLEVETQSRLSILAACENPDSITPFTFRKTTWALPQTGQMWLERELLENPDLPGIFCSTTSYRDEQHPNPERHLRIFPMFEFESKGTMQDLQELLESLCEWMGFGLRRQYRDGDYSTMAQHYGTKEIESEQEMSMWHDFSHVFLLKNFPIYSHPFFNMKREGEHARKIDALLYGIETIGSAERSCNQEEMREMFYTISHGKYAGRLFEIFGRERVEAELEHFLSYDFFPRYGGGIGVNRMMRAMALCEQETQYGPIAATRVQGTQTHL